MEQTKLQREDVILTNKCINEMADVLLPILERYHAMHSMMALAHITASNIAAQRDPKAALEAFMGMLRERTENGITYYTKTGLYEKRYGSKEPPGKERP